VPLYIAVGNCVTYQYIRKVYIKFLLYIILVFSGIFRVTVIFANLIELDNPQNISYNLKINLGINEMSQ